MMQSLFGRDEFGLRAMYITIEAYIKEGVEKETVMCGGTA